MIFQSSIFSLVYIMEKTLSEDSDCDSEHIQKFIETLLPKYYDLQIDKQSTYSTNSLYSKKCTSK